MLNKKVIIIISLVVYLVILFYFTLFWPSANIKNARAFLNLMPLKSILSLIRRKGWIALFDLDIAGNLLVFVPLGLLLPGLNPRFKYTWLTGLTCFSLSSFIEIIQYVSNTRYSDIDDVILNTAGGLVGYLAYFLFKRL